MLARWAPVDLFDREFGDVIRRTFGDLPAQFAEGFPPSAQARAWIPPMDVFTADGELHVRIEAPGIDPDKDVDIELAEGRLTIRGDRRRDDTVEDQGYWRREMAWGHFERTIVLPQGVDPSSVHATYDAGILDVSLPLPRKQASKVKVEIGGNARKQLEEHTTES